MCYKNLNFSRWMLLITPLFLKLKSTITFNNLKIHYSLQSCFQILGFLPSYFLFFYYFNFLLFFNLWNNLLVLFEEQNVIFPTCSLHLSWRSFNYSTFLLIFDKFVLFLFHLFFLLFLLVHMAKLGYDFYYKSNPLLAAQWHILLKLQISAVLGRCEEWWWNKWYNPIPFI